MNYGMLRMWGRQFNERQTNVQEETRSSESSVIDEDLVRKVNEKILQDQEFMISLFFVNILQFKEVFFILL